MASSACAQPEIIDDGESGFLLPFENEAQVGKWTWLYRTADPAYLEAYETAIACLADALTGRLMCVWEDPALYTNLSHGALAKARSRFDRVRIREQLEGLYSEAAGA